MTAALITPVAGAYTGTFNSNTIGILDDNGYEIQFTPKGQDINDTDQFGMTLIEGIYRGQDWRLRFRTKEWLQIGLQGLLAQFGGITGQNGPAPQLGVIGGKYSALAGVTILTVVASTPAVGHPTSLTASLALLSPNTNVGFLMTSKVREVPIEQILLPYQATVNAANYNVPFVST